MWPGSTPPATYTNLFVTVSGHTQAESDAKITAAWCKPFVDKLWSAALPTGQYRYYDGTLYLLALLHVSGSFHVWY